MSIKKLSIVNLNLLTTSPSELAIQDVSILPVEAVGDKRD